MTAVVHQAVGVVKDNGTLEDKPDMMIKPDIIRVDIIGIDLTENNPSVRDPGNMLTADNAIAIFLARYPRPVLPKFRGVQMRRICATCHRDPRLRTWDASKMCFCHNFVLLVWHV